MNVQGGLIIVNKLVLITQDTIFAHVMRAMLKMKLTSGNVMVCIIDIFVTLT